MSGARQIFGAGAVGDDGCVFVVSVVTCYLMKDMPRQSFMRMMLYQSPYLIMQAIAVGIVAQAKSRSFLDNLLMALLAASGLQFLSKPFLFRAFGGTGDSPDQYLATDYALFSQSMGTIFAMAVALMLLVILCATCLPTPIRGRRPTCCRGCSTAAVSRPMRRRRCRRRAGSACRSRW